MNSSPPPAADPELRALSAELDAALSAVDTSGSSPSAAWGARPRTARPGMDRHRRIAGILTMLMGALVVLGSIATVALLAFAGFLSGPFGSEPDLRPLLLAVVLGVAAMIAGLAFTKGRPEARVPVAVFAIVSLVAFPVGTAVGGYVLWTLVMMGRSG